MKINKKIIIIGKGKDCPKCFIPMERRSHKDVKENVAYYYTEWDYCLPCKHVQHYEIYKKFNSSMTGQIARFYEEQNQLFNNI